MKTVLFFILFAISLVACDELTSSNNSAVSTQEQSTGAITDDRASFTVEDLSYKGRKVILTRHGACRMDCREIDAYEVQEVINQNKINEDKTKRNDPRGPSIAYEGKTSDGQYARVVVGDSDPAKIITVIDLDNEYDCGPSDCK